MSNRRRAIIGIARSGGRLPSEYQEVAYLQGTGQQYVDTNIYLINTDIVNCTFELTEAPVSGQNEAMYGAALGRSLFYILLIRNPIVARVGDGSQQVTGGNYLINYLYETSLTSGSYEQNGTVYTFQATNAFTLPVTCYIFSRNQEGYSYYFIKAKVYKFEIKDKFYGVPCYRKSDSKPGLYDLVNGVFYTNANTSASTDFTVGPDV